MINKSNPITILAFLCFGIVSCANPTVSESDKKVNLSVIQDVLTPKLGEKPVFLIADTVQYTGTISWDPVVNETFAANTTYTATITLVPKTGFTFNGVPANYFIVRGASSASNPANSGVISAIFPPTSFAVVDTSAILGVTPPALDAIPAMAVSETAQYSGTISWDPIVRGTFTPNTTYTATINLTPKPGFTFDGVSANFFQIPGALNTTNAVNTGVVTCEFPSTSSGNYISSNIGTLKYVPAGRFQRDATSTNVSIISKSFRISQYEITRAQFLAIMGYDPTNTTYSSGTQDPVQKVNWYHAIAFCNKLSLAEGLTPVYEISGVNFHTITFAEIPTTINETWNAVVADWSQDGYRLPTEMEWMWAAMGAPSEGHGEGTCTTGYLKAFAGSDGSNLLGDYAVFGYGSGQIGATTSRSTQPVGNKLPNELGLFDMSGNVYEWCWDGNGPYPVGSLIDYRGTTTRTARLVRGGGVGSSAQYCTIKWRGGYGTDMQLDSFGLRVVKQQ